MTAEPRYRCAFCLRGMDSWYFGGKAPLCVWCKDYAGPVRNPLEWEIRADRTSPAARRYWEWWVRPRQPGDLDEPLTHFFHCWQFPEHHRCAVELIKQQSADNDRLLVRAAGLERELRDHLQAVTRA